MAKCSGPNGTPTLTEIHGAAEIIVACQRDLKRQITSGERRDLLCDNSSYDRASIVMLVAAVDQIDEPASSNPPGWQEA